MSANTRGSEPERCRPWTRIGIASGVRNDPPFRSGAAGRAPRVFPKRTGQEYIAPVMYLPGDDDRIYIFATKGGAPTHPDWYNNLVAVPETTVEVGTETYPVKIAEVTGPQRDQIYAEGPRSRA
jgi:deazaflavin-dependent oxidoreductase (nitroreductase family)